MLFPLQPACCCTIYLVAPLLFARVRNLHPRQFVVRKACRPTQGAGKADRCKRVCAGARRAGGVPGVGSLARGHHGCARLPCAHAKEPATRFGLPPFTQPQEKADLPM